MQSIDAHKTLPLTRCTAAHICPPLLPRTLPMLALPPTASAAIFPRQAGAAGAGGGTRCWRGGRGRQLPCRAQPAVHDGQLPAGKEGEDFLFASPPCVVCCCAPSLLAGWCARKGRRLFMMANRLLARRGRVCLLVPMCPRIEPCAVHSQPALHSQGSRLGVGTLLHTSTRLPIPCPRLPRSCLRRRSAWRASPMPRWLPCWSSTPKSASTTCFAGLLVCGEVPAVCFSGGSMARVCKTGLPPLL